MQPQRQRGCGRRHFAYSCVLACQLLTPAAAAPLRAPYPKAAKVSKDQATQRILVTLVLLGNTFENSYAHTRSQEKGSRVWSSSLFQQHSWICKTSIHRVFSVSKRLFCLDPGKLGPQQLNPHFFQIPLERWSERTKYSRPPTLV